MRQLGSMWRDPFVVSVVVLIGVTAGGLIMVGLAWRGATRLTTVYGQMPYLVSGGIGGVAAAACGLALVSIQARRRAEAAERRDLGIVVERAAALLAAVRDDRGVSRS